MMGVTRKFVDNNVGYKIRFDNSYTRKNLNMQFRPVEESIVAHFQQMIDDGIIQDRRPRAA